MNFNVLRKKKAKNKNKGRKSDRWGQLHTEASWIASTVGSPTKKIFYIFLKCSLEVEVHLEEGHCCLQLTLKCIKI